MMRRSPASRTAPFAGAAALAPALGRALGVILAVALAVGGCADDNRAPALGLVLDQQVVVGDTLRLIVSAEDPDGDRVSFDVSGLPKSAQLTPRSKSEAVVVWSPLITDTQPGGRRYDVVVKADDGRGGSARQAFGVVVYPTFGVPTFNLPAGVVLNLAEQDDIALLVEVKDDDSTDVTLEMTEGPDGAKLQRADSKTSYFYWKPDDLQRTVAVHRAIFRATDESHAPVSHTLTIVLLNAEKQSGCEGTPPTVVHQPPADQTLDGPLVLTATATDAQSQVEAMVLHWTRGDPAGNYATQAFARSDPQSDDWSASVDLGGLPGDGALVYYYLTASDNDDPTGIACDREGRYPKVGFFTAAVYPDGTPTTTCADDLAEPDSDIVAAPTLAAGTYAGRRICGEDVDYAKVTAPGGTTIAAAVSWNPRGGDLALRLVDADGQTVAGAEDAGEGRLTLRHDLAADASQDLYIEVTTVNIGVRIAYTLELAVEETRCSDDGAEGDSSPDTAKPIAIGQSVDQKICPGDADFFVVNASPGAAFHAELTFDHRYGDLDLELLDGDGSTVLAQSATEQSIEALDFAPTAAGPLYLRVYGVEGATNGYALALSASSGVGCTADGLGQNTSPATASTLFEGVYEGFVTCGDAPDWFVLEVNGGETVDVLALSQATPVRLELYEDPNASAVATGAPDAEGYSEVTWTRATAGKLWYTTEPASGDAATYELLQDITDPAGACQDDRLEPNAASQPVPIETGVTTWLRLCGMADSDAFTIDVQAFSTLAVLTAHSAGSQYTDLEVLAPTGEKLWDATDFGDGAYIEEVAEVAGKYTIIVRPFDVETSLGYDLAVFLD
ncbi:MAG: hypothetical protein U1F43_23335 [Myxococcota bacterium]